MTLLIDLALRGSCVLLAGLAVVACQRRQPAALRHATLAMAILASFAVVPLGRAVPAWSITLPSVVDDSRVAPAAGDVHELVSIDVSTAATESRSVEASKLIVYLWAAGALLLAVRLVAGVGRLGWIAARSERVDDDRWRRSAARVASEIGLARDVILLQADAPEALGTWGLLHPRVLLPRDALKWTDERILVVLRHEFAHVRRHDWLVQLAAEAARAACWFNPLMWLACNRLRREGEQACDDIVLTSGIGATAYAGHLLDLARRYRPTAALLASPVSMARPSTLERRIAAMLNATLNRQRLSPRAIALIAAALAVVAASAASLRAGQSAPLALTGSVYDPTGAVLPQVELTLSDSQGVKTDATTDAAGLFQFPPVPSGKYTLEAKIPGFKALRQEITLASARDWKRVVTLQVGDVRETISVQAKRISAPRGQAAAAPTPVRVGGNIRPPKKLKHVQPAYPEAMREAGFEGTVPLEARIAADGRVQSVRVLTAEVHPDLAQAAADAVRQWQFEPTRLNGAAVEVVMNVSISFTLSD